MQPQRRRHPTAVRRLVARRQARAASGTRPRPRRAASARAGGRDAARTFVAGSACVQQARVHGPTRTVSAADAAPQRRRERARQEAGALRLRGEPDDDGSGPSARRSSAARRRLELEPGDAAGRRPALVHSPRRTRPRAGPWTMPVGPLLRAPRRAGRGRSRERDGERDEPPRSRAAATGSCAPASRRRPERREGAPDRRSSRRSGACHRRSRLRRAARRARAARRRRAPSPSGSGPRAASRARARPRRRAPAAARAGARSAAAAAPSTCA